MPKILFAAAVLASLLAFQDAHAQGRGLPPDVAADLRQTAEAARAAQQQEEVLYRSMGNPYLADARRRQAAQRAEADILASVSRNGARYPQLAGSIGEEASRLMPEHAERIRATVQSVFPGTTGRGATYAVQRGPVRPGTPVAAQPSYAPAQYTPPTSTPPVTAAPVRTYAGYPGVVASNAPPPVNLYNQPILQRYSGTMPSGPNTFAAAAQPMAGGAIPAKGEAISGSPSTVEVWDPIEPFNRIFHAFNEVIDTFLLRPIAWSYGHLPTVVKDSVARGVENTRGPVIFANKLLQGDLSQAGSTLARFVVNSTVGIGGLLDPAASYLGMPYSDADFGQTLYVWGLGPGPYLELPVLGPSNSRDTLGRVADAAMSPWGYILGRGEALVMAAPKPIVVRERYLTMIDELREGSVDFYVSLRDVSQQIRAAELDRRAGKNESGKALDDMFQEAK